MTLWAASHEVFSPADIDAILGPPALAGAELLERMFDGLSTDRNPTELAQQLDVSAYMTCQLLRDSDATSMASSLELRVPLVDVEICRFARACREEYRIDEGSLPPAKRILVEAARDLLGPEVIAREKRGFSLPYREWLAGPLRDLVRETSALTALRTTGLVRSLPRADDLKPYPQQWALVILEGWLQTLRQPLAHEQIAHTHPRHTPLPSHDSRRSPQ
ncbi:MAG: hypothetical protein IPJ65_39790 [Archangiaceae bacterium]|nr:hypothetical protein [Archangiaceae bacterium]